MAVYIAWFRVVKELEIQKFDPHNLPARKDLTV